MAIPKTAPLRESLLGGKVKGGMIRSHVDWVRSNKGEAELDRLLGELPPDMQTDLKGLLSSGWYPFAKLVALDRAIERLFGGGQKDFLKVVGKYSADVNLRTTYKVYRRDGIHDFFRRSAPLHAHFQDFGKVEYEQLGERTGRIRHRNYAYYSPLYCQSALGYYEQVIVIHGGQHPVATESSCTCRGDQSCQFEMRWW